jgi:cytochrome subunit of sulfide dehydrogenase
MTKQRKGIIGLGAAVLLAASVTVGAAPNAEMLSNACAGCHGTRGASAGPSMPSIAGQNKVAFVEAMKLFKTGERPSTVMGRLAKGYSDEEIDAMADYFSKQKPHRPVQTVDKKLVAQGKKVYDQACKRCHLENGKEFEENQPVVAGQWLKYLQIQTAAFTDGSRKISEKKKEKVEKLTPAEWEAMAHYYASIVK